MQKWIVKFVTDENIPQEEIVEALDYTKAYLATIRNQPISISITSVERVCGAYNEEKDCCDMPDVYHRVACPLVRSDDAT
jgi:hypothetical protein